MKSLRQERVEKKKKERPLKEKQETIIKRMKNHLYRELYLQVKR